MDAVELYRRAVAGFGELVRLVADDQWHSPTPDPDWDVRDLVNHLAVGSVERQLGLLATTMARWEDATAHFEAALARNEALASPPLVARTRADYASMLARRGEPNDHERAAELRRQAATTARELGITRLLAELEAT
ncbi:MAG: maleylpyruvate isomerase N-terminal domain-containing protein [Actinomycetota bacterium]|nr:maleylpyruvate isomerase N-terminal domain-containing protein [Actinomycetota bacterium]